MYRGCERFEIIGSPEVRIECIEIVLPIAVVGVTIDRVLGYLLCYWRYPDLLQMSRGHENRSKGSGGQRRPTAVKPMPWM